MDDVLGSWSFATLPHTGTKSGNAGDGWIFAEDSLYDESVMMCTEVISIALFFSEVIVKTSTLIFYLKTEKYPNWLDSSNTGIQMAQVRYIVSIW